MDLPSSLPPCQLYSSVAAGLDDRGWGKGGGGWSPQHLRLSSTVRNRREGPLDYLPIPLVRPRLSVTRHICRVRRLAHFDTLLVYCF